MDKDSEDKGSGDEGSGSKSSDMTPLPGVLHECLVISTQFTELNFCAPGLGVNLWMMWIKVVCGG